MGRRTPKRPERSGWLLSWIGVLFLIGSVPGWIGAQENQTPTRADLEKVADQSTVELTTVGRKTGQSHTKPIWFVYDQGRFYIQSGKGGKTDWYQNLQKTPRVTLKIDTLTFTGMARFIDDPAETERIHGLFRSKYLTARLLGAVGSSIGHGKAVEVELPF